MKRIFVSKPLRAAALVACASATVAGDGDEESRVAAIDTAYQAAFEHQIEDPGTQAVRLYGQDIAIVTARLWLKGTRDGQAFDRRLWFSDTYVRTSKGWRYAFGQASSALPSGSVGR
jgi:ketosteroid isomerase-like protein